MYGNNPTECGGINQGHTPMLVTEVDPATQGGITHVLEHGQRICITFLEAQIANPWDACQLYVRHTAG